MVPLAVIVRHKFVDDVAQTSLAERNYSIETLFTHRAHEPLRVGIGIRRLKRRRALLAELRRDAILVLTPGTLRASLLETAAGAYGRATVARRGDGVNDRWASRAGDFFSGQTAFSVGPAPA